MVLKPETLSGPSDFRASMGSPAGFTAQDYAAKYERIDVGDWESVGSSNIDDGFAISEIGISPEIVKALSGRGIQKLFPTQVCYSFFEWDRLKVICFFLN